MSTYADMHDAVLNDVTHDRECAVNGTYGTGDCNCVKASLLELLRETEAIVRLWDSGGNPDGAIHNIKRLLQ